MLELPMEAEEPPMADANRYANLSGSGERPEDASEDRNSPIVMRVAVSKETPAPVDQALGAAPPRVGPERENLVATGDYTPRPVPEPFNGTGEWTDPPSGPTQPRANPVAASRLLQGTILRYFGDYEITRELGRGGMGVVYEARQVKLNRPVALKMVKAGLLAGDDELRRFQNEAEAVARMDHPGIVPVYEVGDHDGQRYFSMKLVGGGSLAALLDWYKADPRAAARLLADAAEAVAHAHMRGILHRDLKPANILIDEHGHPHITDFGLAKQVEADEVEMTASGAILGTPAYMAPEQARGRRGSITTATDVYGLGSVLYALLTGKAPFGGESVIETLDAVRARLPEPPTRLNAKVPRDLETICLKCLDKEPSRRYPSAQAVADDLRAWLDSRPITARRIGAAERSWLWCKRQPVVAALLATIALAVVGGTATVITVQAMANASLTRANNQTRKALADTRAAQEQTVAALAQSEESRKQAEAVGDFLVDALKKPDPWAEGKEVKVADVLDQAIARLQEGFAGSKTTEGALFDAIGRSYSGLGLPQKAEVTHGMARAVRQEVLGPTHRDTLLSTTKQAESMWNDGRRGDSMVLFEETLKRQQAALGFDDPDTLGTRESLAWRYAESGRAVEAIDILERVVATRDATLGPDHHDTLESRINLGDAYRAAGRHAEAIALHESTSKRYEAQLGPDHLRTLNSCNHLAASYQLIGRLSDAISLYETTLKRLESKLGPDHPNTLTCRNNLAVAKRAIGQYDDAVVLYETTLKRLESKLGPDHPDTLSCRNNLAVAYRVAGRAAEAIPLLQSTLKMREAKLGPTHPTTLKTRNNLALAYRFAGQTAEAITLFESTLKLMEAAPVPEENDVMGLRINLAAAYMSVGRAGEGIPIFESTLKRLETKFGRDHPMTIQARNGLAKSYEAVGRASDAEALSQATRQPAATNTQTKKQAQ